MEIKTIEDCFYYIQNGANIKQGILAGGYPITRIETISNDKFNRDKMGYAGIDNIDKYISYVLEDGDLLMSHINSIQYLGRTVLYEKQENEIIIHGMNLLRLKADLSLINPRYAKYYFNSRAFKEQIRRITKKSVNQASFAVSDLKKLRIKLPTLIEQKETARTLDDVNKLIALYKEQLQRLNELIKSRFMEMFGDPIINERCWNRVNLGNLCKIGSSKRIFEKEYVTEGVPFYRTKEIVELSKGCDISTELFITRERFNEIKEKYGVPVENDLLISAVGTIGVIWVVDRKQDFYFKDGNLIKIDASDAFDSIYMKYLLENLIENYKNKMSTGTAYSALTILGLKEMPAYDVPISLQKQFSAFVHQVNKLKLTAQKSLSKLETLQKALMQQYFG